MDRSAPGVDPPTFSGFSGALPRPPDEAARVLRRVALPAVGLLVLAGVLVALHIRVYPRFSLGDEPAHLDYVLKMRSLDVIEPGDRIDRSILRQWACRGVDFPDAAPPCGPVLDPSEFPAAGFNYLSVHPPGYYFATSILARPLEALGFSLFHAARLVGILWLWLGLLVWWMIAAREGMALGSRIILVVLLASTLNILHVSASTTNDAPALLAGSLVLGGVVLWERDRRWVWVLPFIAWFVLLLKFTNAVGVLAAGAYLLIRAWTAVGEPGRDRRGLRDHLFAGAALAGGAVAALLTWQLLQPRSPVGFEDPFTAMFLTERVTFGQVWGQLTSLVTPLASLFSLPHDPWVPSPFMPVRGLTIGIAQASGLAMIVGCAAAALHPSRIPRMRAYAVGALLSLVLGAGLMVGANLVFRGVFHGLFPRYGLSAVPLLAIGLGAAMQWRPVRVGVGALAAGSLGVAIFALTRASPV